MPIRDPPHTCDFIRTETIEPAGLSVTAAAGALQVSRPTLSSLLNGKGRPVGRDGATYREGVRCEDGHADADAVRTRHRADPQARESAFPASPTLIPSV
jgi:hypothetical protein